MCLPSAVCLMISFPFSFQCGSHGRLCHSSAGDFSFRPGDQRRPRSGLAQTLERRPESQITSTTLGRTHAASRLQPSCPRRQAQSAAIPARIDARGTRVAASQAQHAYFAGFVRTRRTALLPGESCRLRIIIEALMIGDSLYCLIIESFRAFGLVLPVLGDLPYECSQ